MPTHHTIIATLLILQRLAPALIIIAIVTVRLTRYCLKRWG